MQDPAAHADTSVIGGLRSATVEALADRELELADLHLNFSDLRRLILQAVEAGNWLDGFLLAAGASQVIEDHIQGVGTLARRAAAYRSADGASASRAMGVLAGGAAVMANLSGALRRVTPSERRLSVASGLLWALAEGLCAAAFGSTSPEASNRVALLAQARVAIAGAGGHPRLDEEIVRLPSCFRSFDQRPEDMASLIEEFGVRWPDRQPPLVVVGVRTSGSYLAPISATHLRALGYLDVHCVTVRPDYPIMADAQRALDYVRTNGGSFLVVDDPPASGQSVLRVVEALYRLGASRDKIVLLLPRLNEVAVPEPLSEILRVELPWDRWHVVRQMQADAVEKTLGAILAPDLVLRIEPLDPSPEPCRGHVGRRFNVQRADSRDGNVTSEVVVVEGAGLGYLGRHAVAVHEAIPDLGPELLGFRDGIIYRRWVSEDWRGPQAPDEAAAPPIAAHVVRRHRALKVAEDRSQALRGRQPAWEIAAASTSRTFGRFHMLLRPIAVDPVIRRVLRVHEPSVVDGAPWSRNWFVPDPDAAALKTDIAEGAFSHHDLASYDPVFDLAGVAVAGNSEGFSRALLNAFELAGQPPVDPERWALLSLVHLWNARRLGYEAPHAVRRASSRVLQSYFAARYLQDLESVTSGPWCALDLDGVLETSPLGFSATTRMGALALRALRAHGFRPLLATGRSIGEVVERCTSYGLEGGVAEYGAVCYDARSGTVVNLLPDGAADDVARLKALIIDVPGLTIDPDFLHIVRVSTRTASGGRRSPDLGVVGRAAAAITGSEGRSAFVPVVGDDQTDFVPVGVDKGSGLRTLLDRIDGNPPAPPLSFAVGDSPSDLAMFELAVLCMAPANAHTELRRRGVHVVRRSFQAGLFTAVGQLVGHEPGSCSRCRAPELPPDARNLMSLLSFQEAGTGGALRRFGPILVDALRSASNP